MHKQILPDAKGYTPDARVPPKPFKFPPMPDPKDWPMDLDVAPPKHVALPKQVAAPKPKPTSAPIKPKQQKEQQVSGEKKPSSKRRRLDDSKNDSDYVPTGHLEPVEPQEYKRKLRNPNQPPPSSEPFKLSKPKEPSSTAAAPPALPPKPSASERPSARPASSPKIPIKTASYDKDYQLFCSELLNIVGSSKYIEIELLGGKSGEIKESKSSSSEASLPSQASSQYYSFSWTSNFQQNEDPANSHILEYVWDECLNLISKLQTQFQFPYNFQLKEPNSWGPQTDVAKLIQGLHEVQTLSAYLTQIMHVLKERHTQLLESQSSGMKQSSPSHSKGSMFGKPSSSAAESVAAPAPASTPQAKA